MNSDLLSQSSLSGLDILYPSRVSRGTPKAISSCFSNMRIVSFCWYHAVHNAMLFPCGFSVFRESQPDHRISGGLTAPMALSGGSAKTPCAVGLPSAVTLGGVHLQPRPFTCLIFDPRKSRLPPITLFFLCETRPKRGLRRSVGVFPTSRWGTRHRGHGGSQGRHSRPLRPSPGSSSSSRRGFILGFLRVGRFPCLRGLLRIFSFLSYELR